MAKKKLVPQICTSVSADSLRELARKGSLAFSLGSDLVEFRIDMLARRSPHGELERELSLFAERAIFTVRTKKEGGGFRGNEAQRLDLISRLADLRPAYLDVELSTAKANEKWRKSLPDDVKRIVSWHDFEGTPSLQSLRSKAEQEMGLGSLAKVVTTARSVDDNVATLTLCGDEPGKIVSFCMGELGTVSRVVSMAVGAPLVYASIPNEAVAPGQLSVSTMRRMRSMVV